jgi:hypothetical protein
MRARVVLVVAVLAPVLSLACGPTGGGDDDGGDSPSLVIRPASAELVVDVPGSASQAFQVFRVEPGGEEVDVTGEAILRLDRPALGSLTGATLTATGNAAGPGVVTAQLGEASGQADVVVRVRGRRVVDGAPAEAPGWFDGAADDAALTPSIVYPADRTLVPPNLGDFEVHFTHPPQADLFEVGLASAYVDLRLYLPHQVGLPATDDWTAFALAEWTLAAGSEVAADLAVTVRAMVSADPTRAGRAGVAVHTARADLVGGIYYWAAAAPGGYPGIYRHDMSRPGEPAEPFYTQAPGEAGRCVACHVVSRDGSLMAVTFDGGNGPTTMLDVASRSPRAPAASWNFATFDPTGSHMVGAFNGVLTLYDVAGGAPVGALPTGVTATHPDISPDGDRLAFVGVGSPGVDWAFGGGAVMVSDFDAATGTLGAPTPVADSAGNDYYPSFSPDAAWILYNRSGGDAYDDPDAEIWVVPSGGGTPQRLDPVETSNQTNSWPRWAPFESSDRQGDRLYWFTFSSKRDFGVRLRGAARPQIWMAPFYPDRAARGEPATAPAFRLPFQALATSNHIAQWTEQVVEIE